ncbi:DUF3231 family protein [Bacillus sp. Marseille-Q3570]|uniref:DUF3231 family protein n=1 Tax=Bacillus sp. Marseille-Q3570 TaxID=2963522 RepID=UPI0021B6F86E|nr:DUF3231 family protein [Bacillus sp. Marseille-Q3570]
MEINKKIRLTSAELSQLWTAYMNDTFSVCVLKYFLNHVEDDEIRPILQYALQLAETHVERVEAFFNGEDYPIPYGFKVEEDVDINAPRLFEDSYYLVFLNHMGKIGLNAYSMSTALSDRTDIYEYFSSCLEESIELRNRTRETLLSKGLYIRSPYIPAPHNYEFVTKQSFLTGYFGKRRPLTSLEIANLYENIQRNALGAATMMAYSQVARHKKVTDFLSRGKEIAKKHVEIFSSVMREDDLPVPMTWDTDVTESTTFTFSDKLMMFQTTSLSALSIGYYGTSVSTSPRRDLGVMYGRLIVEVGKFSEDGANIMIDNRWLEQPPMASNREKLKNLDD